jgi:hypothetical protein
MSVNTPQIQISRFADGGFVLHKVTSPEYASRFSAWYDVAGNLLDADQITGGLQISRTIKRGGPAWRMLETMGKRYIVKPDPFMVVLRASLERDHNRNLRICEAL